MQAVCPKCSTLNSIDNKFCGNCGASLENAKVVTEVSQAEAKAATSSKEIMYYSSGNVLITSSRAVFGSTTYSMINITSVTMGIIPPNRLLGILIALPGLLSLLVGIVGIAGGDQAGFAAVAIGVVVGGIGIFVAARAKPKYQVRITSAAGEAEALSSGDRDVIERIIAAMNGAISEHG